MTYPELGSNPQLKLTALQGPWIFITPLTTRHETNFTCVNLNIAATVLKISIHKMLLIWRQDFIKEGRKEREKSTSNKIYTIIN